MTGGRRTARRSGSAVPVVDHVAASVLAQAILAALFHRARTGRGDDVSVSLLDVTIDMQRVNAGASTKASRPDADPPGQQPAGRRSGRRHLRHVRRRVVVSAYTDDKFRRPVRARRTTGGPAGGPAVHGQPRPCGASRRLLEALAPYFATRDGRRGAGTRCGEHRRPAGADPTTRCGRR
ncbi:hypothetical protein HBB16_20480 [Pseudonocardia sp. MCCB 268]|nr:hypothetical protein [Pseudonocardia cytotoxica]